MCGKCVYSRYEIDKYNKHRVFCSQEDIIKLLSKDGKTPVRSWTIFGLNIRAVQIDWSDDGKCVYFKPSNSWI